MRCFFFRFSGDRSDIFFILFIVKSLLDGARMRAKKKPIRQHGEREITVKVRVCRIFMILLVCARAQAIESLRLKFIERDQTAEVLHHHDAA